MSQIRGNGEQVILGAGDWYLQEWLSGPVNLAALCVLSNLIGNTSGGATLEYTIDTYTVEDDRGRVRRTFKTKGNATLKTGLLTFDVAALSQLMSMGEVSTHDGKTILKLKGGKESLKKFCVGFVYEDDDTGEIIRVGMVATNTAGLTLAFAKDKETVVDVTFTAESNGVDDVIVVIEEEGSVQRQLLGAALYDVTAPVKSATPQATHDGATGYTAAIAWELDGEPHTGAFAGGKAYTAVVTLTAADGYGFTSGLSAANVMGLPALGENGDATAIEVAGGGNTAVIRVTYKATAA